MSLSTILQRLAFGLSLSACSSQFKAEQYHGDGGNGDGKVASGPGKNTADQPSEENCYTAGCPQAGCTFYDDYSGKELAACKWKVQAGAPLVGEGTLRLADGAIESTINFQYLNSACSLITTELSLQENETGDYLFRLSLDGQVELYLHPLFDLQKRWVSVACALTKDSSAMFPLELGRWNTLRLEITAAQASLYKNGEELGSVGCENQVLPGRIAVERYGTSPVEIDYIVQRCGK